MFHGKVRLSVKGTREESEKALTERGLSAEYAGQCGPGDLTALWDVRFESAEQAIETNGRLVRWYSEPEGEPVKGYGFKPGTLLFYSEVNRCLR